MIQEDKELLLKDLCARLPYGVKCYPVITNGEPNTIGGYCEVFDDFYIIEVGGWFNISMIKPYLRPMSSMTEEEILDLYKIAYDTWYSDSLYYKNEEWITFRDSIQNNTLCFKSSIWLSDINKAIDWLNKKGFDYHGLIEKGLALEAPEGMYKI